MLSVNVWTVVVVNTFAGVSDIDLEEVLTDVNAKVLVAAMSSL